MVYNLTQYQKSILCSVNVQHDCSGSECNGSRWVAIRQEYMETTKSREQVRHADSTRYLLNIFSVHNYEAISNVIPAPLGQAITSLRFVPDSTEVKLKAAAEMRQKKKSATKGNAATTGTNAAVESSVGSQTMATPALTSASEAIPMIPTAPTRRKRKRHGDISINSSGQQTHGVSTGTQHTIPPVPSHTTAFTHGSARDPVMRQVQPVTGHTSIWQASLPPPVSEHGSHSITFTQGRTRDPVLQQVPLVTAGHASDWQAPLPPPPSEYGLHFTPHHALPITAPARGLASPARHLDSIPPFSSFPTYYQLPAGTQNMYPIPPNASSQTLSLSPQYQNYVSQLGQFQHTNYQRADVPQQHIHTNPMGAPHAHFDNSGLVNQLSRNPTSQPEHYIHHNTFT